MGDCTRGQTIFIRNEYKKLRDIIFSLVNNGVKRNFVVTGTPGVGKSIFNFFLLYLLRLEGKTVLFDLRGKWYRFSDKGVELTGSESTFVDAGYFEDGSSWLLCDPDSKPTEKFLGVTVVTVSSNLERTKEFMKQPLSKRLFMDIWSLEELQMCRDLIYPSISKHHVDEAFQKVGGVARVAFAMELGEYLEEMEQETNEMSLSDYQSSVRGLDGNVSGPMG